MLKAGVSSPVAASSGKMPICDCPQLRGARQLQDSHSPWIWLGFQARCTNGLALRPGPADIQPGLLGSASRRGGCQPSPVPAPSNYSIYIH